MGFGSWLRNHPRLLERSYASTHRIIEFISPAINRFGLERTERLLRPIEEASKKAIFDCRMCGQCVLHSTGMTCPMSCPKNLRNGPCGGVRVNGHCEVIPDMKCVWVEAWDRSKGMATYGSEFHNLQPPVNRQLEGRSAWITQLTGEDKKVPASWIPSSSIEIS